MSKLLDKRKFSKFLSFNAMPCGTIEIDVVALPDASFAHLLVIAVGYGRISFKRLDMAEI